MGELVVDDVVLGVPEPVWLPVDEGVEDWLAVEEGVWVDDGVPDDVPVEDGVFDGVPVVDPVWEDVDELLAVTEPVREGEPLVVDVSDNVLEDVPVAVMVDVEDCANAVQTDANARTRRSRVRQVWAPRRAAWSDITVGPV